MNQQSFVYTPFEFSGEWQEKQVINELLEYIRILYKELDPKNKFIKDPDKTFMIGLRKNERVFVLLTEGESSGFCVFWYSYRHNTTVRFVPGPWIKRIELMVEEYL